MAQPDIIAERLRALLPVSPDAYLQKLDVVRGVGLVIRFSAHAYRGASFLDDRILGPGTQGAWLPGDLLSEAGRSVAHPRPVHFVFHSGHVGSTLVSRLLDEGGSVLSLREPLPLRTIADAHDTLGRQESLLGPDQFSALLAMALRLWSRGYEWTRAVVVKATSSAARLGAPLLAASAESRGVCLNVAPQIYLATLLAGRNSPDDLRGHGPGRIHRLQARCSAPLAPLHSLSLGELAALSWVVETMTQRDLLRQFGDRLLAIDFDHFLEDAGGGMQRIATHFALPEAGDYPDRIAASGALQRYSKAPDHQFSPADRAALLRDSREQNRAEIARGLAWLERLARTEPAVAALFHEQAD